MVGQMKVVLPKSEKRYVKRYLCLLSHCSKEVARIGNHIRQTHKIRSPSKLTGLISRSIYLPVTDDDFTSLSNESEIQEPVQYVPFLHHLVTMIAMRTTFYSMGLLTKQMKKTILNVKMRKKMMILKVMALQKMKKIAFFCNHLHKMKY